MFCNSNYLYSSDITSFNAALTVTLWIFILPYLLGILMCILIKMVIANINNIIKFLYISSNSFIAISSISIFENFLSFSSILTTCLEQSVYTGVSTTPPQKHPPLSCEAPLKSANCPSPLFQAIPPIYWFFGNLHLKLRFFHEPKYIKVFHSSPHLIF